MFYIGQRTLRASALIVAAMAGLSVVAQGSPFRYTITWLDVDATTHFRGDINNAGEVLLQDSADTLAPILLIRATGTQRLGVPLKTSPGQMGLSASGVVYGSMNSLSVPGIEQVFTWAGGEWTKAEGFQADANVVRDMNSRGQLAGYVFADSTKHGFIWEKGRLTLLPDLFGKTDGRASSQAWAINNSGVVAGVANDTNVDRAAIWENGQIQNLGTFANDVFSSTSRAYDINDGGIVVGTAQGSIKMDFPFVWSAGEMAALDLARWADMGSDAHHINNYNVVLGENAESFVWYGGKMLSLKDAVDTQGLRIWDVSVMAMNDRGQILVRAQHESLGYRCAVLEPIQDYAEPARLANISVRADTGKDAATCIAGFVVRGGRGRALIRAVGPALSSFGITKTVQDPHLEIYSGQTKLYTNDNWGTSPELADVFSRVGAFSFPQGSRDAALAVDLPPGNYTAHVLANGADGVVLAEVSDASDDAQSGMELVNLSARVHVGTGEQIGIAGFVVEGNGPCKVLIRAVGPGLSTFGVSGVLADPLLNLFTAQGKRILGNDNWGTADGYPLLAENTRKVGAFALADGSKDAVLMTQLEPGAYTVHVTGVKNTTGIALLEVYMLPRDL